MSDNKKRKKSIEEYLEKIMKDKKKMEELKNVLIKVERIIEEEIEKVRQRMLKINGEKKEKMVIKEDEGKKKKIKEKV